MSSPHPITPARDVGLDVARGLGMILVIYGHTLQILFHKRLDGGFSMAAFEQWQAIYGFHMPLFFMISGMITGQFCGKTWKPVFARSLYFLFLAYAIDAIGTAASLMGPGGGVLNGAGLRDYFINHILRAESFSTITLWYLAAFAVVRLAAFALLRLDGAARWGLAGFLILGFGLSYLGESNIFHIRAWVPGILFFMLGRQLAARAVNIRLPVALTCLVAAAYLAPFNGGCTFAWQSTCENAELPGYFAVLMIFGLYGHLGWFVATAILGAVGMIGMGRWLASTPLAAPLAHIGRNTLNLLIINGFYLVFANPYLRDVVPIRETLWFYGLLAVAAVAVHWATLVLAKPVLCLIGGGAERLAQGCADALWPGPGRAIGEGGATGRR